MIQNVLSRIGGISLYGVVSICIFVAVFVAVVAWILTRRGSYLKSMRELPLEEDLPAQTDCNLLSPARHE